MNHHMADHNVQKNYLLHHIPTGMKVKSAILFSMFLIILSWPLFKNAPELVRTLCTNSKVHTSEHMPSRIWEKHHMLRIYECLSMPKNSGHYRLKQCDNYNNFHNLARSALKVRMEGLENKPAVLTLASFYINNSWFHHMWFCNVY